LKKQLTTAEEQEPIWDCPIIHWVTTKKDLNLKLFAVFAVVELRF